jgi:broad specificity phosphatase PhoE
MLTKTLNLVLLRHGTTDHNTGLRLTGWGDPDLNEVGRSEAAKAALDLAATYPIEAIYTSTLKRAQQTAAYLSEATGLPLNVDADLKELNFGEMEGRTIPEMRESHPELFTAWRDSNNPDFGWPGGETRQIFHSRVDLAIWRAIQASIAQGYDTVAIVGHGAALAGFVTEILVGSPFGWRNYLLQNCEHYVVAVDYPVLTETLSEGASVQVIDHNVALVEKEQVSLRVVKIGKTIDLAAEA